MKVILVDDEHPALRELEYLLQDYADISVIGSFTNPLQALKEIRVNKPDIVFLDINMPQYNGLNLAWDITKCCPSTALVFTTAYDSYAVDAFDISALDYLVKPIKPERLKKTILRFMKDSPKQEMEYEQKLLIKSFGGFQVYWENQEPIKWRTKKTKEVFAFLIANYGDTVSKYQIIDAVWPEINPDNAEHQLECYDKSAVEKHPQMR